jgi:hypothetical protein
MRSVRGRDGTDQATQNWSVQGHAPGLPFVCLFVGWLPSIGPENCCLVQLLLEGRLTLGPLKRMSCLSESYKFCG